MEQKKYWQSFGEMNHAESEGKPDQDEFNEGLPFEDLSGKGLLDAKTPRRDFLKYLGFSTAAAMAAASCEMPIVKSVPYLNRPQDITPGEANYYATTYVSGGEAIPVIAKVRDGRPIKLEGNELSAFTRGGTSARMQASVLDLYDTARLRFPLANGKEVATYEAFDKMVTDALGSLGGAPLVLLTGTVNSPTTKQIITEFLTRFPGSRHVQYDPISHSGMLLANEASYGRRAIPSYRFENARVVVSLGADFLGTWLSPVEFQKAFANTRRVNDKQTNMSKLYQFEGMLTTTGASADDRYTHRPSETGAIAVALLNAINGQPVSGIASEKLKQGIEKAAKDLTANRGGAVVISGSNNADVQVIVNAINEAIGANGTMIDWSSVYQTKQGIDRDMATLLADMEAGRVGGLIVYDANPAYDYVDADRFKNALKKLRVSISLNEKLCETSELCKYVGPSHHFLESWGDAEPKTGFVSLMQPTIQPLFKTRQYQDTLLKWTGNATNYAAYFREYWIGRLGGPDAFNKALQDGVLQPVTANTATATQNTNTTSTQTNITGGADTTATVAAGAVTNTAPVVTAGRGPGFNGGSVGTATAALAAGKKGGEYELVLYQNVAMGDGRQGNNPWLLELPDPITKATWDNYAMISPALGKKLFDLDMKDRRESDEYEVEVMKPEVRIRSGNRELVLPALIIPGMNNETIAIAVGYGRKSSSGKDEDTARNIGRAAVGAGKNAFNLATFSGVTVEMTAPNVTVESTGNKYKVAQTQTHSSYEGRKEVIKELTLNEYKQHPNVVLEERDRELKPWGGLKAFAEEGTLYPTYDRPGIKWGMSIDLNTCFGCSACVVACNVENNIPVVGKNEVARFHEMHWLRIDRYFSGDPEDPESIQTVFQPMLCQHCDNAPCENVCPVAATNHNSEGINQMIYNRCIGTRYCANNCPYKVRRFNWADYMGADSFPDNQTDHISDATMMMGDDLTRMVLNPDVTVRSRGVIEKCSFCVQRMQEGKLKAKRENRVLADNDSKTACQQACPANAIVYGNVNNPESIITRERQTNISRLYYALEPIHTLPNVNYLAKVRNTDKIVSETGQHDKLKTMENEQKPAH